MNPEQVPGPDAPQAPAAQQPIIEQPAPAYPPSVEIEPPITEQAAATQQPTEEPAATQPQVTPPPYQAPAAPTNPGKTPGIVGFIFAFVGLQIIGLPLSIIAVVKSRKAGFKNPLAVAGIVLNAVFLVVMAGIIASITMVAYQGIQVRANTQAAATTAMAVMKQAEAYNEAQNSYPQHTADVKNVSSVVFASAPLSSAPSNPNTIAFYDCGSTTGNKIAYWDYSTNQPRAMYTGSASDTDMCTLATN